MGYLISLTYGNNIVSCQCLLFGPKSKNPTYASMEQTNFMKFSKNLFLYFSAEIIHSPH